MKCPVDNTTLTIADRQGIEIDFCPECRGVWLDRGELDKIIDRSDTPPRQEYREERSYRESYHDNDNRHYKKKKKESFLGEIFDF